MGKSIPPKSIPKPRPGATPGRLAAVSPPGKPEKLRGISDVRRFFHRNEVPIYFVSATNFNLLNMDEWVRNFRYINYIDCFDGAHPHVFVPPERPHDTFESLEEIINYLLAHPATKEYVERRGPGGKAVFLFFDARAEELCAEMGLEVCFPPAELREHIDNKIHTTRIGNRARVWSVPNVLTKKVDSYEKLRRAARRLGDDLVVQTAFGDSGHTTFFISGEEDWEKHAEEIVGQGEIKIMKRIRCTPAAIEACVTRRGTIVGPLMTELVGFKELTPYRGGWCGNEVFADAFPPKVRAQAQRKTVALGKELAEEGYRGYFEVDFLLDQDSGRLYLGELNPRITGASSMTNLSAFAHADAPLFLFHLLEWMDVDFDIDVEAINRRWSAPENIDSWSQMVIKHTEDTVDLITAAPRSGIWGLDEEGEISFVRVQTHRRTVETENRAFFLRIAGEGDYRYEGADLGILLTPGRLMDGKGELTERARAWIRGIRGQYRAEPVAETAAPARDVEAVAGFKML